MLDNRFRISELFELCLAQPLERIVNRVALDSSPLGNKVSDVVSLRIALLGLTKLVKDPEVWLRVGTCASTPLPTTVVAGKVLVDEVEGKVSLSLPPVVQQMLGEEHSRDHTTSVVNVALIDSLSLSGVYDRVSCFALLPSLKSLRVAFPLDMLVFGYECMTHANFRPSG